MKIPTFSLSGANLRSEIWEEALWKNVDLFSENPNPILIVEETILIFTEITKKQLKSFGGKFYWIANKKLSFKNVGDLESFSKKAGANISESMRNMAPDTNKFVSDKDVMLHGTICDFFYRSRN